MKTTEIEVTTDWTKTWLNKTTKEKIQLAHTENEIAKVDHFYHFDANQNLLLDFPASEAKQYLEICDQAVMNNRSEIPVAKLFNTSFLSMVLTQFLHVRKSEPAHDIEE